MNGRIDLSNRTRILHTWFQTRWRKVCHSPDRRYRREGGAARNLDSKSRPFVGKMETKFKIYLRAIGAAKKPDEMKVWLLLNHIGEPCLEIYSNFIFLPERDDPAGGEDKTSS